MLNSQVQVAVHAAAAEIYSYRYSTDPLLELNYTNGQITSVLLNIQADMSTHNIISCSSELLSTSRNRCGSCEWSSCSVGSSTSSAHNDLHSSVCGINLKRFGSLIQIPLLSWQSELSVVFVCSHTLTTALYLCLCKSEPDCTHLKNQL